jgi:hypothetical protein
MVAQATCPDGVPKPDVDIRLRRHHPGMTDKPHHLTEVIRDQLETLLFNEMVRHIPDDERVAIHRNAYRVEYVPSAETYRSLSRRHDRGRPDRRQVPAPRLGRPGRLARAQPRSHRPAATPPPWRPEPTRGAFPSGRLPTFRADVCAVDRASNAYVPKTHNVRVTLSTVDRRKVEVPRSSVEHAMARYAPQSRNGPG